MTSEFTIDIQLTELGFHTLPVFDEELPMKDASSSGCLVNTPPTSPRLSPDPSKTAVELPGTSSELLSAPPKLSPSPPKTAPPSKPAPPPKSPVLTQGIPLSNKPSPAVNSPVDQCLLYLVQHNVHSLPKTLPVAVMVTNTPSSQSPHMAANVQPQPLQLKAAINDGTLPEEAASIESNSSKELEDPLKDVVFTETTVTLGKKHSVEGKAVNNEKKAIVVRYTSKQNSAEKTTTAKETLPQKDTTTSQSDGDVGQSQEDDAHDESDDSEVSEEEEEVATDEDDDSQYCAPDLAKEHRCNVCDQIFINGFLLREHMHQHTGVRPYRCAECNKQFCQLSNYRAHLRTHAQAVPIRCQVCQASFDTKEGLQLHLQTTHFEDEFYQCDYCKRVFTCMNVCLAHVQKHKSEASQPQCTKCGRRFMRLKSLRRHVIKHTCQRTFLCSDCGQSFRKKNVLLRHSFSHLGLLPYTCMHCNVHFRLASQYRKHKCNPESIQCVACLTTFTSHKEFEEHKRATGCWGYRGAQRSALHKQRDEIRCMECGRVFPTAEELKRHAGTHQRVLKCAECGMGFRSALMLMSHMGGHVGQKPCLCQKCGLGFPHQQGYDLHLKDCGIAPPPKVKSKPASNKTAKKPSAAKETTPSTSQKNTAMKSGNGAQTRPPESTAPAQSEKGVWKLTLDKTPPPNAPLVVLLPMSASVPSALEVSTVTPPSALLTQHTGADADPKPASQAETPLASLYEKQQPHTLPQPGLDTAVVKAEPGGPGYSDYVKVCHVSNRESCEGNVVTTLDLEVKLKDELRSFSLPEMNGADGSEDLEPSGLLISDVRSESLESSNLFITDVRSESSIVASCSEITGKKTEHVEINTTSPVPGLVDTPLDLRLTVSHSDRHSEIQTQKNGVDGVTQVTGHNHDELEANKKVTEDSYFTSVEVDLRDDPRDELDEEEEEGEPHECMTCGAIILEGDLIEHYMEHAMQGHRELTKRPSRPHSPTDSLQSSSSYCPSGSGHSSPSATPPASPPSKRLRSRAK